MMTTRTARINVLRGLLREHGLLLRLDLRSRLFLLELERLSRPLLHLELGPQMQIPAPAPPMQGHGEPQK